MTKAASILEDNSLLSRLDKGLHRVELVLALISGIAIFCVVLFAGISVTGRNVINMPLPGYVDWIEQLMALIAFLGIAYTQRDGTHIRMDILIRRLQGRFLWAAEFITTLMALILMLALIWGSWAHFERSFDFALPWWSSDSSLDIGLPLWPAKLIVPVAFSVLCLRFTLQLWGYGRAFVLNLKTSAAVPLIKSIVEQAAEEAKILETVQNKRS